MTYSVSDLETLFANADEGAAPDPSLESVFAAIAQQELGGFLNDAEALNEVLHLDPPADGAVGPNTPQNTTDVALAVYQFFTGSAPSLAGLDYLVNGGGNPNDLDSAYYAGFNQANRYYNFAINLITGNAAVAANFAAQHGSATFDQVVTAAYESIVGTPDAGGLAAIESQLSYFQQVAAERAPNVNQDLATKAIAIAYILEEAIKDDVGAYAYAIDHFNLSLAQGGDNVPGETANGVDLLTQFPTGIVWHGQTFTLTADAAVDVEVIAPISITENNPNGFNPPMIWVDSGFSAGVVSITQNGEGAVSGSTGNIGIADYYSTITGVELSGMGDNVVEVVGQLGPFNIHSFSITNSEDTTVEFTAPNGALSVTLANNTGVITFEETSGHSLPLRITFGANPGNAFSGLAQGDTIILPTVGDTLHIVNNTAGVAGEAVLATGTYSVSEGTFTYSAAGADALLTYDSGGGQFVSIALIGGAAEAPHATLSGAAITW